MKYALNILLLFTLFQSSAQNLVPNPSFEDTLQCTWTFGDIQNCPPWFQPTAGTPDQFHECYVSQPWDVMLDVPLNNMGYQQPVSGKSYAGLLIAYPWVGIAPWNWEYREYIEAPLNSPLTAGETYYVSMFLSLADSSHYYTNSIGVHFTVDSLLNDSTYAFVLSPSLSNSNYLSDKTTWMEFRGEYIAQGGEKFITIGNFENNLNTDTIPTGSGSITGIDEYSAYYYIDDICVSTDSLSCYSEVGLNELSKPEKELIRIVDTMGRETEDKPNTLLIYVYSDGTTEKVFRLE